jgi:hypothetical protein
MDVDDRLHRLSRQLSREGMGPIDTIVDELMSRLVLRAFKIVGGIDVVGVGSGLTGRGLAWCRSWCGG